eukprot:m.118639 g.118639  ORF g.118639 m.118639 type:complete len:128 (+) comp13250_c0_seq3:580-963(+)
MSVSHFDIVLQTLCLTCLNTIQDHARQDLSPLFAEMADFIQGGRRDGGVVVHCAAGISRASTTCIAYMSGLLPPWPCLSGSTHKFLCAEYCQDVERRTFSQRRISKSVSRPAPSVPKRRILAAASGS